MKLHEEYQKHGFELTPSGGGCEWYTKELNDGWFIAVTEQESGIDAPTEYGQAIHVGLYDHMGEMVELVNFNSSTWFFKIIE